MQWEGKSIPQLSESVSARLIERYQAPHALLEEEPNHLFLGDNLASLTHLLRQGYQGTIKLVYIDPPFDSGAAYTRRVHLRGPQHKHLSLGQEPTYHDVWTTDGYLQFIYERLILLRALLHAEGVLYMHCNSARTHHLRLLLDEVFGPENFRNTLTVRRVKKNIRERTRVRSLNEATDCIHVYARSEAHRFLPPHKPHIRPERWHAFDAPSLRPNLSYTLFGHHPPPGRHWLRTVAEAEKMMARGDLRPNPRTGRPEYRIPASREILHDSLWDDLTAYAFSTSFPTEKKEDLLTRILEMSTAPGDWVLDGFLGSGTTAVAAQRLGRRWIGCDNSLVAMHTTIRRIYPLLIRPRGGRHLTVWQMASRPTNAAERADNAPPSAGQLQLIGQEENVILEVAHFASPAVQARLHEQGLDAPEWRAQVDAILVDPAYDGQCFQVRLADFPRRAADYVQGRYALPMRAIGPTLAVKVIDVLGHEHLLTTQTR